MIERAAAAGREAAVLAAWRRAAAAWLARRFELEGSRPRVRPMEGIRGLAVLLVFCVHYHQLFSVYLAAGSWSFAVSEAAAVIGHAGVDLFFVLSGFLIYEIVMRRPSWWSFTRRRIQRIYPAFLAVLAVYVALTLVLPGAPRLPDSWPTTALYLLQNAALLPGLFDIEPILTVAWTLSYEIFFYLSLPLVVWATGMTRWKAWRRSLLLTAGAVVYLALRILWPGVRVAALALRPTSHLRMLMFTTGMLVRETLWNRTASGKLGRRGELGAAALFAGGLAGTYCIHLHRATLLVDTWRVLTLALSCFGFFVYCLGFGGRLARWFGWDPLRWLGNMSYSYYLIHGLSLHAAAAAVRMALPPAGHAPAVFWGLLPVTLAGTLAAGAVLFLAVEKPLSLAPRRPASG